MAGSTKKAGIAGTRKVRARPAPDESAEVMAAELTKLIGKGLPVTLATAGTVLPNMKNVLARAVHPEDPLSRLDSLNDLLPKLIDQLTDETYKGAARILFGLETGTRRTTKTSRRRQAAELLGYHQDHFRVHIEPEMVRAIAELLHRDWLRYKGRVRRSVGSLEPTGDTPTLTVDDLTAEEELVSRIWQHVYGLRAEMIAHLRLSQQEGYEGQAEDHRQAAGRTHDALQGLLREYVETYGALIRHGEAEFAAEGLERLSGWRG